MATGRERGEVMPEVPIDFNFNVRFNRTELRRLVDEKVASGEMHLELRCDTELAPHAIRATQFTLDKTKYRLRLSDETETSVKVWIERKD